MAGTLFLVGTPIGNLKDITYRAVETLATVDYIACEDTRVSMKLLNAYSIKKPLISYYKHKERESAEKIIELLRQNKNVALITDAGMPSISDPGALLVQECRKQNFTIQIIPGVSAVVSAVALSGIDNQGFIFLGFLPEKNKDKNELIDAYKYASHPLLFYCSPHDINGDANFLFSKLGDRKVFIVKEITKLYESVIETKLEEFHIEDPRGEYVLIIMPSEKGNALNELSIIDQVKHYMQSGLTKKESIKRTATDRGVDKNTVYSQVIEL